MLPVIKPLQIDLQFHLVFNKQFRGLSRLGNYLTVNHESSLRNYRPIGGQMPDKDAALPTYSAVNVVCTCITRALIINVVIVSDTNK